MMGKIKIYMQMHKRFFLGIVLIFISFLSGWMLKGFLSSRDIVVSTEKRGGQYGFTNPLLECEGAEGLISKELSPFRGKIEFLIKKNLADKKVDDAAVYFRDLNNGPWFGIKEKEPFLPGSLLKIPIMMGYLKEAETNPSIMKQQIKYERRLFPSDQYVKPAEEMQEGRSYTIDELIYRMVVNSDNEAAYLLRKHDKENVYYKIYKDLRLPVAYENVNEPAYNISVRKYASFFRILFNASYLDKDTSNKALGFLNSVKFREGIVKGIPLEIPVAHKFGERNISDTQKQFHDCGIVYYPNYPYLLCVMTRGSDFDNLVSVIQDVSRLVYEEVDSQRGRYSVSRQ